MEIAVVGGAGHAGRAIVEGALVRELAVTAFVRFPEKLTFTHPRLRIVQGDARDQAALERALPGATAVVSALSTGTFGPTTQLSKATATLISALEAGGPRRLLVILSVNLLQPSIDEQFANIHAEHQRVVELLEASTLSWTAICPPWITNEPATGSYTQTLGALPATIAPISKHDLALATLNCIEDPACERQLVAITG